MSAPTPGPWIANAHHAQYYVGRTYGFVRALGHLAPLAAVALDVEGVPQDEGRANLSLLAAAPDLLEALLLGLEYWEHRQKRYRNRSPVWVEKARAAIAKAGMAA